MRYVINLDRYPLDKPESADLAALIAKCNSELVENGLFNLPGFFRDDALAKTISEVTPILAASSFIHARSHNIYFKKDIPELEPHHPSLREFETSNQTICADQMEQSLVTQLYEWPPFAKFLAAVMDKQVLHTMADPLARVNVMSYGAGQALNWHFDRSEFTTTLLLQAPTEGGAFEYDKDLRSDTDPNFDGVADLLEGRRLPVQMPVTAGTLNVFKGKNTAHRVTPVVGEKDRIIAVFSYYAKPGVQFSNEERIGFYGRAS